MNLWYTVDGHADWVDGSGRIKRFDLPENGVYTESRYTTKMGIYSNLGEWWGTIIGGTQNGTTGYHIFRESSIFFEARQATGWWLHSPIPRPERFIDWMLMSLDIPWIYPRNLDVEYIWWSICIMMYLCNSMQFDAILCYLQPDILNVLDL